MSENEFLYEWLVCPDCGYDDFDYMPRVREGKNSYLDCPECGKTGTIVG